MKLCGIHPTSKVVRRVLTGSRSGSESEYANDLCSLIHADLRAGQVAPVHVYGLQRGRTNTVTGIDLASRTTEINDTVERLQVSLGRVHSSVKADQRDFLSRFCMPRSGGTPKRLWDKYKLSSFPLPINGTEISFRTQKTGMM